MSVVLIWVSATLCYTAFYSWYVGFKSRLSTAEVDACCTILQQTWPEERIAPLRAFLARDTGREFYMANLLKLHRHTASGERGSVVMQRYEKPFLKAILRRACHPIAVGIAASSAVECWGVNNAESWTVVALVRYRSRRDLMQILLTPSFQQIHLHKEQAVEKTIAFASDPAFVMGGGPKLTVPLMLVVIALVATLLVR